MKRYWFESEKEMKPCHEGCHFYHEEDMDNDCRITNEVGARDVSLGFYACPVKELKPRKLNFVEVTRIGCDRVFVCWRYTLRIKASQTVDIFFEGDRIEQQYGDFLDGKNWENNLRDAIKYCQEHFNKLFEEVIGE